MEGTVQIHRNYMVSELSFVSEPIAADNGELRTYWKGPFFPLVGPFGDSTLDSSPPKRTLGPAPNRGLCSIPLNLANGSRGG